jgi:uncharacterized membrane protein YraQ (UPF0718 family)
MIQLNSTFTLFLSLLLESLPFLLLGILVSSWLLVFVDEHQLVAKLPRNPILGAIVGSSLGMLIPVTQYGNIPVTRRLLMEGVPLSVAVSFFIAAPTINPFTIWLTWKTFPEQPLLLVLRVLLTWVIAVTIATIFSAYKEKPLPSEAEVTPLSRRSRLLKSGTFLRLPPESQPLHRMGSLIYEYKTATSSNQSFPLALSLFLENAVRETVELGSLLLVGCAIAAAGQTFLPQTDILSWGQTPPTQILALMLLGFILSLGSSADIFFVTHLTETFLKGALLSFLLFSSIIDLKSLGLIFSTLRLRAALYLIILGAQLTFLLALLLDFYVS